MGSSYYKVLTTQAFSKKADVTIFEFFDYNCGYCKSVTKTIIDLLSEEKNFVFVEFHISQDHILLPKRLFASKKQICTINFIFH